MSSKEVKLLHTFCDNTYFVEVNHSESESILVLYSFHKPTGCLQRVTVEKIDSDLLEADKYLACVSTVIENIEGPNSYIDTVEPVATLAWENVLAKLFDPDYNSVLSKYAALLKDSQDKISIAERVIEDARTSTIEYFEVEYTETCKTTVKVQASSADEALQTVGFALKDPVLSEKIKANLESNITTDTKPLHYSPRRCDAAEVDIPTFVEVSITTE